MKPAFLVALLSSALISAVAQTPIGQFDGDSDVGGPTLAGSASYDAAAQDYTLTGAGTNMWFGRDQFHFLWKKMKGDFILRARIEFVGKGAVDHRKVGWMIRPSLEGDAPYADCAIHGSGLDCLQFRRTAGAPTEQFWLTVSNADVMQLERKGTSYIFSAAHNGEPFVSAILPEFRLGDEVYAGLYICSHDGNVAEKAIFHDVRLIKPAPDNFVPYHDYLGSSLQILDVQSGKLEEIYHSDQPFEAPNWTRDGKSLIYNVSGRDEGHGHLVRFDLETRTPTVINTEPAIHNNNDHVLSFDGTMLGISDQTAGQSRVNVVPLSGGTPKQITPVGPSYCHGWSPDGKFLVFTGGRNGKFQIYKISADGSGPEIQLTDAEGLNDGPEYTPDGSYIYFNSSRTGKMQVWRMKPDGSSQEQVTRDDFNNWFPHISPDGKLMVFLSFGSDVSPTDHPYYKRVYIRMMPLDGGEPRVIAYLYGGQGTMNVPSWSPDSKRIAFVSNSK
ncbi:MAG TPA: biopolymer transporter TolR [Verrucomicrobiae bacterium]|jgi:Tol biopolymer transport system component/regulation of enolase protein 1 (concanavalin A-like superfamily)